MHLSPLTRHEHYLEMRALRNSDVAPDFTVMDCLFIAYGPGHNGRRCRWEHRSTRSIKWSLSDGVEITITAQHLPERR